MRLSRQSVLDALLCGVALGLVLASTLAWVSEQMEWTLGVAVILASSVCLALGTGAYRNGRSARDAAPLVAGVTIVLLGALDPHEASLALAPWAVVVALSYQWIHRAWFISLPRAAAVIIAGAACSGAMVLEASSQRAPYGRVLGAVAIFALLHALLEWIRRGRSHSPFSARLFVLSGIGAAYATALTLVIDRLRHAATQPWTAVATAAAVCLGAVAVALSMRIWTLNRVTNALAEAATTTPWPSEWIDATLIQLISRHVRASSVALEPTPGGPETLSAPLRPGGHLVVRRSADDFAFSRYDARLVAGITAMARASHAQADRENRLWAASVTDERTTLWSYEHWRDHLRALMKHRRPDSSVGVVFLDLDHFKQVNSDFGHLRADQLLATVGRRLASDCPDWTFGRFGGDEFVGVTTQARDEAHFDAMCRDLAALIRQPVETDGITIAVTASIGQALAVQASDTAESLIARAEQNLRHRKAQRTFPAAPIVALDEEEILRRILDQGVDVAYQPIIDVNTHQVIGCEALLRGSLPMLGNLNPEQLVGSAVRAGVLDIVTRQLAKQALETMSEASRRLGRTLALSINLEQEQFRDSSQLLRWLVEEADRRDVSLILEITERGIAEDWGPREDALATQLESFGIGLSLDDLGAGNSRLPLLTRRAWHSVKLDRALLMHGHRGLVMLTHIVALLRSLDLPMVMEGVETAEQMHLVQELGIPRVQGHYFAAASTAAELFEWLERDGRVSPEVTAPRG